MSPWHRLVPSLWIVVVLTRICLSLFAISTKQYKIQDPQINSPGADGGASSPKNGPLTVTFTNPSLFSWSNRTIIGAWSIRPPFHNRLILNSLHDLQNKTSSFIFICGLWNNRPSPTSSLFYVHGVCVIASCNLHLWQNGVQYGKRVVIVEDATPNDR